MNLDVNLLFFDCMDVYYNIDNERDSGFERNTRVHVDRYQDFDKSWIEDLCLHFSVCLDEMDFLIEFYERGLSV